MLSFTRYCSVVVVVVVVVVAAAAVVVDDNDDDVVTVSEAVIIWAHASAFLAVRKWAEGLLWGPDNCGECQKLEVYSSSSFRFYFTNFRNDF